MGAEAQSPQGAHLFEVLGAAPEAAARHGLSAIIAGSLTGSVPDELARDARQQVAAGLKTRLLTLAVVDALAPHGVIPVLLKGYALAVRLYPQPLARPSSDVDVLVTPGELEASAVAMRALGLSRQVDASLEDPLEEHHHLAYAGPRGLVEVHFRLFSGFGGGAFNEASLRQRLREYTLDGRRVLLLNPEDEFVYLATHAANHAFLRLSWLVDLTQYLRLGVLDWPVMEARARAGGFHAAVAAALQALEDVLGARLPEEAHRHFRSGALRRALNSRLFSRERVASARLSGHWLAAFGLRLLLVDTPAHGVRHILEGARRTRRRARS